MAVNTEWRVLLQLGTSPLQRPISRHRPPLPWWIAQRWRQFGKEAASLRPWPALSMMSILGCLSWIMSLTAVGMRLAVPYVSRGP